MSSTWRADRATLIADLNDLLQLDRDAIETYTVAINSVQDDARREQLVAFRADHHRHADALATAIRARGAMAIELPHITGLFKIAVQAMGAAVSMATRRDAHVLLALRVVEGQVRDKYTRFAGLAWPADLAPLVTQASDDERRHYAWLEDEIRALGVSDQSLTGSVGAAAEVLHTWVAGPIESAARQMMQMVTQIRPERRGERSDSAAPLSPVVEAFRSALRAVEVDGTLDSMVSCFDGGATLSSPRAAAAEQGPDGARRFWSAYRDTFPNVRTTIDVVQEAPGVATLSWTSRMTGDTGAVTFRGITVLEHAAGRITRLLQRYDAAEASPARPMAGAAV